MSRDERQQLKDLHTMKPERAPFFNGWLIVAFIIPMLSIPYWSRYIGEGKEYPNTMWLWLIGAEALAFGVRSYQYVVQRK